jgi:YHS domain-containing protein
LLVVEFVTTSQGEEEMKATDPVCGMEVETTTAQWKTDYQGKTYYFCSPGCKRSFEKEPEKYLQGGPSVHMGHSEHSP